MNEKKEKLNLKEEIESRDIKIINKFIFFIFRVITFFSGIQYHCKYKVIDKIRKEKGPCFIIFNHLSRFDYIFVNNILFPKRYNFVATYNEFFKKDHYLAFKLGNVIAKKNFNVDPTFMKNIDKVIKSGGSICFSPEGMNSIDGRNYPVVPGTGYLFKYYKIPVYQIELRGQYMFAPKYCLDKRLGGKCTCSIKKLYSPEDLEKMSVSQIDNDLNARMNHDEFEWQKEHHYKYDLKVESCKNLEDLCFMCPKCGSMFTMKSKKGHIYCENCKNGTYMNDYYEFVPFENSKVPESPSIWYELERKRIYKDIRNDKKYSFSINIKLGKLPIDKPIKKHATSVVCGDGVMVFDHNGISFDGSKDCKSFMFNKTWSEMPCVIKTYDLRLFSFYVNDEYYDFIPKKGEESKVGYIELLVEEMHRLHSNNSKKS